MIVRFGGIDFHHCLNFLFITLHNLSRAAFVLMNYEIDLFSESWYYLVFTIHDMCLICRWCALMNSILCRHLHRQIHKYTTVMKWTWKLKRCQRSTMNYLHLCCVCFHFWHIFWFSKQIVIWFTWVGKVSLLQYVFIKYSFYYYPMANCVLLYWQCMVKVMTLE